MLSKTLLFVLLIGIGVTANAGEWKTVSQEDGVTVAQRTTALSKYAESRGEIVFGGRIDAVAAVLADADAAPKWLHDCKQGREVQQISLTERVNYTVIDAPLFFDDRDSYVHSFSRLNAAGDELTIRLRGRPDFGPEEDDRVRVLDIRGHWEIKQLSPHKVNVVYQIVSNPQISAVDSVNDGMAEAVAESLKGLAKLAAQAPYKAQRFTAKQITALQNAALPTAP